MSIGGISLILIGGIINLILVLWQLSTGMHWINVQIKTHRLTGILLVFTALLHGSLAIAANVLG